MNYLIIGILIFALFGAGQLSYQDWKQKNVCPKILGIPACYYVVLLFVFGLLSHLFSFSWNTWLYFSSIGIIALIALKGTLTEWSGTKICPRASNGTPLCYYSLALSSSLILLKWMTLNLMA